jgi:vacuolar-type H+-ATPase subunit I/STV1
MAEKGKIPIAALVILLVISLLLALGGLYSLQKEREKNLTLLEEIEDIKTKQKITETKLEESKNTISGMEVKLQETQTQIDTLTRDLGQGKADREEALSQIEQLKTELNQQKELRSNLENKLTQAQEEVNKMQSRLTDLESKKAELESKVQDLQEQVQKVELGKIVVGSEGTPANPASTTEPEPAEAPQKVETGPSALNMEGKVLVVNRDYNFAVFNLGSRDNINVGDIFSVYQDNKYLGDIKVSKVHDSMSAADFVSLDIKDKVREGDKVVPKTK